MRHFAVIADLNVAEKKIQRGDISFSAYFISVYISFIIVKNCGFVMWFVILAIYFRLKTTKNLKIEWPTFDQHICYFSEFVNGFSLAWSSILRCHSIQRHLMLILKVKTLFKGTAAIADDGVLDCWLSVDPVCSDSQLTAFVLKAS